MRLLDTWAWIEYFDGSKAGERVRSVVESEEIATSILTIAELGDLHARGDKPGLEERVAFMASRGRILDVTLAIAQQAGKAKWAQRRRRRAMGLGDALIYETARAHGLTVLTGDVGFKGLPGVELIG